LVAKQPEEIELQHQHQQHNVRTHIGGPLTDIIYEAADTIDATCTPHYITSMSLHGLRLATVQVGKGIGLRILPACV